MIKCDFCNKELQSSLFRAHMKWVHNIDLGKEPKTTGPDQFFWD